MRRLIVLLLLLAGSAHAAVPPTGSRIDPTPKAPEGSFKGTPQEAAKVLNGFSRCVVDVRPKFAADVLAYPLSSPEQEAALRKEIGGEELCMRRVGGMLRIETPTALVTGMAEELFLAEHRDEDLAALIGASNVQPRNVMEDIALCLARGNPAGVRAIIDTTPGTPSEKSAVRAIVPDLPECIPQGTTIKLNELTIRLWAAAGLYLATEGTAQAEASAR